MKTKFITIIFILFINSACQNKNVVETSNTNSLADKELANVDITKLEQQAKTAYESQDWYNAAVAYNKLTQLDTENSEYWFYLGNIYSSANKKDIATDYFNKALIIDPKNVKASNNLGLTYLHQAANTFVNMRAQLNEDDPMYARIDSVIKKITDLMIEYSPAPSNVK